MQTRTPIQFSTVTILCERVKLVPISEQYSDIIFQEFTDEITRYMVPATPSRIDEIYAFIRNSDQLMRKNADLIFAIVDKKTDEFYGVCGLHGEATPKQPILGIWLKKSAHGYQYGLEAIKQLAEWAKLNLIFDYLVYPCDKDNIPSRKIAEALNGKIFRTGQVKSMSGKILNEVAYKIL